MIFSKTLLLHLLKR